MALARFRQGTTRSRSRAGTAAEGGGPTRRDDGSTAQPPCAQHQDERTHKFVGCGGTAPSPSLELLGPPPSAAVPATAMPSKLRLGYRAVAPGDPCVSTGGGPPPFPITLLAYCVLFTANGAAQTAGALPRVLELPASTRAMALGNAYMMNARHADAVFYHPALLTGASGFGLDLQRWGANSSSTTVSAARQWLGGGIGVGLQTLQYGAAAEGSDTAPGGPDPLFPLGSSPAAARVAPAAQLLAVRARGGGGGAGGGAGVGVGAGGGCGVGAGASAVVRIGSAFSRPEPQL